MQRAPILGTLQEELWFFRQVFEIWEEAADSTLSLTIAITLIDSLAGTIQFNCRP